jgi:hypothetical protein
MNFLCDADVVRKKVCEVSLLQRFWCQAQLTMSGHLEDPSPVELFVGVDGHPVRDFHEFLVRMLIHCD